MNVSEMLHYDPETGIWTWLKKPNKKIVIGSQAKCKRPDGYLKVQVDGQQYLLHRLAWFYMTGKWPKEEIDHINGIRDDNRWCNLREATCQQNLRNSKMKNNKNGYKGIHVNGKGYLAQITNNGKVINLGTYSTKEKAAKVYNDAAIKYFGEYASLNQIKEYVS